ncbi:hypothetical protein AKJ08_2579 [Vulgatibacter incomptus]|uniref:EcxA zinc-binding domain-containing protein n=1 Tax=Vulgatibacter incomptus TaxID=1391653 RepID=A0A0K1PFA3_9BACT|nr:hypothetical protein AKJ08_2579 [Vulgatibacter incomptus]
MQQPGPHALEKSFFVGKDPGDPSSAPEFYSRATLVGVGYSEGNDERFTAASERLARLKWTIYEDFLIGRLTYERVDGNSVDRLRNDGVIAAMFRIGRHVDFQRRYNPATGENLYVEDTESRPWYERKYMQVDWSKNLNTDSYDFDTLSMMGVYGGVKYEPSSYYLNDPADPDAPRFDLENGYFDITTKVFAVPQQVDLRHLGWGIDSYPACFLGDTIGSGSGPSTSCNPAELTIRQSFKRVTNTDYEPADWDGYRSQAFGALTSNRFAPRGYEYGGDRQNRFINRYNIWERSHFYRDPAAMTGAIECSTPATTPADADPNRGFAANGTADECVSAGAGSRCDTFNQKCTLPFRARKVRPQPLFFTLGSNLDYFDATDRATQEWDTALRAAVMSARYAECMATRGKGSAEAACEDRFPVYFGQQEENDDAIALSREMDSCLRGKAYPDFAGRCDEVAEQLGRDRGYSKGVIEVAKLNRILVLCHSPVEANDPAECGGPRLPAGVTARKCEEARDVRDLGTMEICDGALSARRGDLRYHQVNVLAAPQSGSPWAIMADASDPLSGEKISASIDVSSHVTDLLSQDLVDIARYAAGELPKGGLNEAEFVYDWSGVAKAASKGGGALPPLTREELERRLAEASGVSPETFREASLDRLPSAIVGQVDAIAARVDGIRSDVNAPSDFEPIYEARRKAAVDDHLDMALTTKAMQEYAGSAFNFPGFMTLASPLQGANPVLARKMRSAKEVALAEHGACVLGDPPAPVSIANLARHLERKFGAVDSKDGVASQLERAERMRRYLASRLHSSLIAHELGHSVALRHNFVSSSDAWGYRPQYWQLRTRDGERKEACTDLNTPADCVGPRYFDPVSDEQSDELIQMFMHSSVMDHPGEILQDMVGLGAYDFAAARSFYGDTIAVFGDPSYRAGLPRGTGMLAKDGNFGGTIGMRPMIGGEGKDASKTTTFHYSQIQNAFSVIDDCRAVDATRFEPAAWDEKRNGAWDPLFDGFMVKVNGSHTRCKTQQVDYVPYASLRFPTNQEIRTESYRGGPSVDPSLRVRVPYGFATDRWADTGNVSVLRYDNGADIYELFDFLIAQKEMSHILDNHPRNKLTFSVRATVTRSLARYDEKLRDATKGLGLQLNICRDLANKAGHDPGSLCAAVVKANSLEGNLLASGLAFDHFSRLLARPEAGPHSVERLGNGNDDVLRSGAPSGARPEVIVPYGATGRFGGVSYGGMPVGNVFARDDDGYKPLGAGSYYEKAWSAMLMTESVDNFIGAGLDEFVDARFRAVSLADIFPDGYRRWLANNLTGDDAIKGPRLATDAAFRVRTDADLLPSGIAWTSWWPASGPESCSTENMSVLCTTIPASSRPVDPQVGWEQQKFLIAYTLMYLPENSKQAWLDQLAIWEVGHDDDPGFANRIELHDPWGTIWVARTFGKETIFGKTVQKGIAARVLEYANELVFKAYETEPGTDLDGDGSPDWYVPVLGSNDQPRVKFDPTMKWLTPNGAPPAGCNETDNSKCTCDQNRACVELGNYSQLPYFLRQALGSFGFSVPGMKGSQ